MSPGPDEVARQIQRRRPGWSVWFGRWTGHYWALACWVHTADGLLSAAGPDALEAAIAAFELLHPKPKQRYAYVGH